MKNTDRHAILYNFSFWAVAFALLLFGCQSKNEDAPGLSFPEVAQIGEVVGWKECEYRPAYNQKSVIAAECGTLVVPENWEKIDSRLIALPVARDREVEDAATFSCPDLTFQWITHGGNDGTSDQFDEDGLCQTFREWWHMQEA